MELPWRQTRALLTYLRRGHGLRKVTVTGVDGTRLSFGIRIQYNGLLQAVYRPNLTSRLVTHVSWTTETQNPTHGFTVSLRIPALQLHVIMHCRAIIVFDEPIQHGSLKLLAP